MMKILTVKAIESMKPGLGEVPDGRVPGLSVLSGKHGPVSFGLRYRRPGSGKTAKITLGKINLGEAIADAGRGDALTLAQARALALVMMQQIGRGIDPSRDDLTRDTFGDVVGRWHQQCDMRSRDHALRIITKDCEDWWARPIRSITTRDVRDALTRAGARARTAGNVLRDRLSPVFQYALAHEIVDDNVVKRVPRPAKMKDRDRVLTDEELKAVWDAADDLGKILILTGQRLGEVEAIRAIDLDLDSDRPTWTIPSNIAKNGIEHEVALSPAAVAILRATDLPFSSANRSRWRARWRRDAAIDHWRPHDVRRTVATGLARLGSPIHVTELILNHRPASLKGVARIYNRHDYAADQRKWLMLWADHVESITTGKRSNIVRIA